METTNKLPEEFKKKWVAELRSGKHKQGQDVLYNANEDCFCCLGIAGLVCGVDKVSMHKATLFGTYEPVSEGGYEIPAPDGLPEILIHRKYEDLAHELSCMNDAGKSFAEIADYIEANL